MRDLYAALLDVIIFWMLTTPHEFAHAWVATKLGDDTPKLEGRVTLHPLAHVDWIGTVFLPLISSLLAGGFLGWGRPVNTNPYKLRWRNGGLLLVALAGPASNVIFALILAGLAAFIPSFSPVLIRAGYLSLYLAIFNMLPVPPLDGSKFLLAANVPAVVYVELSRFGFLLLMIAMFSTGLGAFMQNWSLSTLAWMYGLFGARV